MLKTLGGLGLQDATGAYTYQGVHSLLLLCYLVDKYLEGKKQHKREALANLLWPTTKTLKNRKNNLSVALKNLREALAGEEVVRHCPVDPYDPSLELHRDRFALLAPDPARLLMVDFTVCEVACAQRDLVTVRELYQGMFLAGVEKRPPKVSGALLTWLEDKRSSLASTVLEACLLVLADVCALAEQRDAAYELLTRLSEHDPEVFIAPSVLADAHAYLPASQQTDLTARLLAVFVADPAAQACVPLLMTMALQLEPDFDVACRVQVPALMGATKARCKQVLDDGDWLVAASRTATGSKVGSGRVKHILRLRGRAFWQRQAIAQGQHYWLLRRLWQETPDRPEMREALFYLAWHYHQGVTPAVAPRLLTPALSPHQVTGQIRLELMIDAKLSGKYVATPADADSDDDEAITEGVSVELDKVTPQAARGMGNFAGFAWDKLTRVFSQQAQQASRMERFAEVLALCNVWERARQQHGEAQNPLMVWYGAYALERQGDYGAARDRLAEVADASEQHRALWASLLLRAGETAAAIEAAERLVHSFDMWAQAEAHSLLAKVAYFAEDYNCVIEHYERAKFAWAQADEPCRAIAAEASVASGYDYRGKAGDVDRANDIYNDLAEVIVRQGLPPLTGLRTRLNQLMLWDYHQFKTLEEIRQGFTDLIDTLERQDISSEVLGKAWYNFGQHYYKHYERYAESEVGYVNVHHSDLHHARVCYLRALEPLRDGRDRVTYGCACGELGRIHKLQSNHVQAQARLAEAVDILLPTEHQSLLAEYQQLLDDVSVPA